MSEAELTQLKIAIFINMINKDGTVDSKEVEFVKDFINKTDLSSKERMALIEQIEAKLTVEVDYTIFKNDRNEALFLLIDLILLAKADGVFHESEQNYVKELGKIFGFTDSEIEKLMA